VVLTASNVDIDFDLKVKKGVEATNILQPEKLNNYESRNLLDGRSFSHSK
jgi:hypothetical protein